MATPLFYVDLSEDARDYRHEALEPGLPLLDRQGVNFQILSRWLGDYVAEPEWRSEDVVSFYMTDDARGRLEDVDCQPVTRGEMEKQFAPDLDSIRLKIKKIKPESSTEQMVHRVLKKTVAEQLNDLENSDFDSFFFKCRAGKEDWAIRWCCGYQRADLEPLRAKLWATPDGDFLGVRPPLQGGKAKKRKKTGPLDVLLSPWAAIALILLVGLFLWAFRPKLVVEPGDQAIPMGGRITYKVEDHRWFFFKDDVTLRALPQSSDPRVVEFEAHGAVANAMSVGKAFVSFRVGSRIVDATVEVNPPEPPDALTLEPADDVRVAIGSTKRLKAIGHYADGMTVDLTTQVSWWEDAEGEGFLVLSDSEKGMIQGDRVGQTDVMVQFPIPREDDTYAETSIGVQVVLAEFTSLAVNLDPREFAVGQSCRVEVIGTAKDGEQHSLTGSSLLEIKVDPTTAARVDGEYLVGRTEGAGQLLVRYDELERTVAFNVSGRALSDDLFFVSPGQVDNSIVYELIPLNVTTASEELIEGVSNDPSIVEVVRTETENAGYEVWLAARAIGETEVIVSQGTKSQTIKVKVNTGVIEQMEFAPPVMMLKVGHPETANLIATTQDSRIIKVVPDQLVWETQPRVENVYVNKDTLVMDPLEATEMPQDIDVRLANTGLAAHATIEVTGGDMLALLELENQAFGVHGPIPSRGRYLDGGAYLGDKSLWYDPDAGGLMISATDPFSPLGAIPKGSVLTSLDGVSLEGMSEDELLAYFRDHPIGPDSVLRYRDDGGLLATTFLGDRVGVVRDFKLLDVQALNLTQDSFNAELRLYLKLPGEYRLADAAGTPLSQWVTCPPDAMPVMASDAIARNPADDYELYVERRVGEGVKRFQVPFKLGADQVRRVVDVDPVIDVIDRPAVIVDTPDVDRVIVDDDPGVRTTIKKTIKRIRRPVGGGASVIQPGTDTVTVSGSDSGSRTVRTVSRSGDSTGTSSRTLVSSSPGASSAGSPAQGSGSRSPGSPSASPSSPSSPSPSPSSPSPSPSSPSPSPSSPSPSPSSPSPSSPSPSPSSPSPSPAPPNSPSPAPPNSNPASPSPAPSGSDTRAPAPAKPTPSSPTPSGSDTRAPNVAPATPTGSDTRAPSAYGQATPDRFRPRTPTGTPTQPAVVGSATRSPGAGPASLLPGPGSQAGAEKKKPYYYRPDDDGKKSDSPILDALNRFNQERKKRENITGQGRLPVIKKSSRED